MAPNAQCSEDGPFFPTTPRYVIQNGMSIEQDILKSPDWLLIGILCAAVFLIVIIIIIALVGNPYPLSVCEVIMTSQSLSGLMIPIAPPLG